MMPSRHTSASSHDCLGAVNLGRERMAASNAMKLGQAVHGRRSVATADPTSVSNALIIAKQGRSKCYIGPTRQPAELADATDELHRREAVLATHAHAREIHAKHQREQMALRELEKLHIRYYADNIVMRRREAALEAGRAAQRALAQSRLPDYWPRDLKVSPRRGRPPSGRTVAASERRLNVVKAKLEAGVKLSVEEESDAAAILELRQRWNSN
jgi:hypothetical protein